MGVRGGEWMTGGPRRWGSVVSDRGGGRWAACGVVVSLWGGGPREGGGGARDPTAGRLTMVSSLVTGHLVSLSYCFFCLLSHSWLVV